MIQAPNRLRPLLGLATFALIGSPVLAQDSSADSASAGATASAKTAWHTGYALIDDSHLSLHLRNIYKAGTSTPDASLPPNYHTWVQASSLDFSSGYWADTVGFDLSYDTALNISTGTDASGFTDGTLPRNPASFSRIGEHALKLKWQGGETRFKSRLGVQKVSNMGMLHARDSRALEKLYSGARLDAEQGAWSGLVAVVDASIDRNETFKRRFTTAKGTAIDYLATAQIKWEPQKNRSLLYFAGAAPHYVAREGLEGVWQTDPTEKGSLKAEGFLYHNRALSVWQQENANARRGFDRDAYHAAVRLSGQADKTLLQGGATYTHAPNSNPNGMGFFEYNIARNAVGRFVSPAYNGMIDYMYHRELMVFGTAVQPLNRELSVGAGAYYGSGMKYKGVDLAHGDVMVFVEYKPSFLKGLHTVVAYDWSRNWREVQGAPDVSQGRQLNASKTGPMIRLDYRHEFF